MIDRRKDRAEAIFRDAIALPPQERRRFIAEACDNDVALRQEVETLLKAHERGFAAERLPPADAAEADYHILHGKSWYYRSTGPTQM